MDTPHHAEAAPDRRASNAVTAVVGLAVVALALVFVFKTTVAPSHWYAFFKWMHVTGAILWVGGGLTLTILALKAERSSDPAEMAMIARQAAFVGERVFAPIGLLVLGMGIAMVVNLDLDWGTSWILIGLIGYAITFLTGLLVLGPQAKRIGGLIETVGAEAAETQTAIKRILLIARVDEGVLLLVVAAMILKPFT
ncbi:MAG TPA: DUF2269 family protein [Gaiellaceae bacterium]|nr:DUF2269 family protein [Gaiellaceae bacterium]